jgi:hypothetical protein
MNDLNQTLRNLLNKIASEDLGLIISVAAIVVTLLLVWLILRRPRLWYWKVDERAGTLKKIEKRLKKVEKQLVEELTVASTNPKDPRNREQEAGQEPAPLEAMTDEPPKTMADEQKMHSLADNMPVQTGEVEIQQESGNPTKNDAPKNTYTGKSGRIYTREELESQIRD